MGVLDQLLEGRTCVRPIQSQEVYRLGTRTPSVRRDLESHSLERCTKTVTLRSGLGSARKRYLEGDLGCQCVSMIDDGQPIVSVPTIQLYAPTALQEDLCDQ